MAETMFVQGNEAVGHGALAAGCEAFFGYPITPQNEITEWMAREFPQRGKVFVQSQSEIASINMVFGAAATGVRCMTSSWRRIDDTIDVILCLMRLSGHDRGSRYHAKATIPGPNRPAAWRVSGATTTSSGARARSAQCAIAPAAASDPA